MLVLAGSGTARARLVAMGEGQIRFSVQASPDDAAEWLSLARRAEEHGFDTLLVGDHPGRTAAPFVVLAAAASVTTEIGLGSYVVNAGVHEPLELAVELATLDLVSDGRARFGVGAGHTRAEWTMLGHELPAPRDRVARMLEVVDATRRLLAGERVNYNGRFVNLDNAVLDHPKPGPNAIPLAIGGGNPSLLRYAAVHADVVGLSGLGRTLEDGQRHDVTWTKPAIDRLTTTVMRAAEAAGRTPEIEVLVQHLEITDDPEHAADRIAKAIPSATPGQVLDCPFVLLGTAQEIAREATAHAQNWRITRFVVKAPSLDQTADVMREIGADE